MYVDHFKLSKRTFTNGPESGFFTPNEQVEKAVARVREVMLARDSVAIVTGGPGVGKSAFISAAQAAIEDKAVVATVDLRHAEADMLTDMLLLSLGAQASDGNDAESLHRLKTIISEHNLAGRRVTAVVDVTGLTVERAKRVLQLIHLAGEPGGQLNIILLGPHALHRLLNAPGLIHLRQRVCYRYACAHSRPTRSIAISKNSSSVRKGKSNRSSISVRRKAYFASSAACRDSSIR